MKRLLLSTAAALLLAAPVAASAATVAARPHVKPHVTRAAATKPMGRKPARVAPRPAGSDAVDALNDQSLARAQGAK